jgi:hypothetical protein
MSSFITFKTTYEFKCLCGYNYHNTSLNAKNLAEKLHSKKCDTYKSEIKKRDLDYIEEEKFSRNGKQKSKRTEYFDKETYYKLYKNTR